MRRLSTMFNKEVVTVRPTDTLARAAGLMDEKGVGALVVVEDQRPVGVITDRDVAIAIGARGAGRDTPVQDVMTCPVETMRQDEGIFRATQHMMRHALRRVPVVDNVGRLVGLVTLDDLLILLTRELDNLARSVEPEVAAAAR